MNALHLIRNPHAVSRVAHACFEYGSEAAHKLLSDNRDLYLQQSAKTVTGRAAPFPGTQAKDDND